MGIYFSDLKIRGSKTMPSKLNGNYFQSRILNLRLSTKTNKGSHHWGKLLKLTNSKQNLGTGSHEIWEILNPTQETE